PAMRLRRRSRLRLYETSTEPSKGSAPPAMSCGRQSRPTLYACGRLARQPAIELGLHPALFDLAEPRQQVEGARAVIQRQHRHVDGLAAPVAEDAQAIQARPQLRR